MDRKLTILMVSPEVAPFSKTGGLADVVGALPLALAEMGHDVRIITPLHKQVWKVRRRLPERLTGLSVPVGDRTEQASVFKGLLEKKVPVYFIRNDKYYDRDNLYGTSEGDHPDNCERFVFFSRACLEAVKALEFAPHIIHCHDWQSGLVPIYINLFYRREPYLSRAATVLTIHNLAYQGLFWKLDLPLTGLPESLFTVEGVEFFGKINFLKAGIVSADLITTVSERYSKEIQTEEFGCGLEGVLQSRAEDLCGILNGADYREWDPATDKYIVSRYDRADLSGKSKCKKELIRSFGLQVPDDWPLVGAISRLADQKGFDLLAEIAEELFSMDLGFVLLGTGEERYHEVFAQLASRFPDRVGVKITFDNALAHKIEAGCDMFLMPSRYEPCGLNQMYSLRYGTIPIVRATGGLDDTIQQFDEETGEGNGFRFEPYDSQAFLAKVKEATDLYRFNPGAWSKIIANAMACDFSWERSAKKYVEVYLKALQNPFVRRGPLKTLPFSVAT